MQKIIQESELIIKLKFKVETTQSHSFSYFSETYGNYWTIGKKSVKWQAIVKNLPFIQFLQPFQKHDADKFKPGSLLISVEW